MKVNIKNYPNPDGMFYKMGINKEQKVSVKIDKWDTYNMDVTLAHIVYPMLVQLKETKHTHPSDLTEEKWDSILDDMIFSFKSKLYNWEEEFTSGVWDMELKDKIEPGKMEMTEGPNHTYKIDEKGRKKYQTRVAKGFTLFGKYYNNLWD
tara:strand:+ start:3600 stop:4049 length:450 start_codon:yes stop_codon:yes gene_type:complete